MDQTENDLIIIFFTKSDFFLAHQPRSWKKNQKEWN